MELVTLRRTRAMCRHFRQLSDEYIMCNTYLELLMFRIMFSTAWLGSLKRCQPMYSTYNVLLQVVETEAVANTEALPITSEEPKVIQ